MWCIAKLDEAYITQMTDVLEVYERPYDILHPVICIDEKNHQLLGDKRVAKKMKPNEGGKPGKVKRIDYEYIRNGVVNEFVCIEPKTGIMHIRTVPQRTGKAFAMIINHLVMNVYADATKVVLVTDNLNTHNEKTIRDVYPEQYANLIISRIEWHYTPKHASWLDQAEIAINMLTRRVLRKRIATIEEVITQVNAFVEKHNASPTPINWQFTNTKAQDKFQFCPIPPTIDNL